MKLSELTPDQRAALQRMRRGMARSDKKRDAGLTTPEEITRVDDLHYGPARKWNALDLYYPRGAAAPLPTIVSVHGGGYIYGTKEVYQFYCMDLARRGFAVVNFNYHLAPVHPYPTPLRELNRLLGWVCEHAAEYPVDPDNLFLVGDSAGAQLVSQYALIWADPDYAAQMGIRPPAFRLAALGLNCGLYDLRAAAEADGAPGFYFAGDPQAARSPELDVLGRIDSRYPPAYVVSAANDFLLESWAPMLELLRARGVAAEGRVYGTPEDKTACHVFHCNVRLPLAARCNDDETAFLRRFVR